MKKFCITFLMIGIIILSAVGFSAENSGRGAKNADVDYLRIHIRADSNSAADQAVKYEVRDAVVAYLTPVVENATSKEAAMSLMNENLPAIERVAEGVLLARGFGYGAEASLTVEEFPTRIYGGYTLEQGYYHALILNLGSGKGDNWWCVVYPPLCFAGQSGENIRYKSRIKEIIEKWKRGR